MIDFRPHVPYLVALQVPSQHSGGCMGDLTNDPALQKTVWVVIDFETTTPTGPLSPSRSPLWRCAARLATGQRPAARLRPGDGRHHGSERYAP